MARPLPSCRQNGSAIPLASAFAIEARLMLAEQEVSGTANQISTPPELMKHGALITVDAMGCRKSVAKQVLKAKTDYPASHPACLSEPDSPA